MPCQAWSPCVGGVRQGAWSLGGGEERRGSLEPPWRGGKAGEPGALVEGR